MLCVFLIFCASSEYEILNNEGKIKETKKILASKAPKVSFLFVFFLIWRIKLKIDLEEKISSKEER